MNRPPPTVSEPDDPIPLTDRRWVYPALLIVIVLIVRYFFG
jgi:hypothetical protein